MNAAVDMIKERYKIGRLAVAGQSGGGSVVASLLSLGRRDIACAAPASGALDIGGLYRLRAAAMTRSIFAIVPGVAVCLPDSKREIVSCRMPASSAKRS